MAERPAVIDPAGVGAALIGNELRVIGTVELRLDGVPIALPPQQAKVLAMLAAAGAGQSVSRAELVDGLWPSDSDARRLWAVMSKLRLALRQVGVTVSSGRGDAGYLLLPLPGPDGVEPADIVEETIIARLVERGERLLDAGDPVAAVEVLRAAAERWRGQPFAVGADWPLPRVCRRATERLDRLWVRLARSSARAGLLADDHGALRWIDLDDERAASVHGDRDVWLLRFVAALAHGNPSAAEVMLEQRRPEWGYHDAMTVRASQLLELSERGAELRAPVFDPSPAADVDEIPAHLAAVDAGSAEVLHVRGGTGSARAALAQQLMAQATAAGLRVFTAVCDAADDIGPWRTLLRDLWATALTDPRFEPSSHRRLLAEVVGSPRPSGARRDAVQELVSVAVVLISAVARRRPALIVVDEAHRLTGAAAAILDGVESGVRGVRVGLAVVGADGGLGPAAGVVISVPSGAPAPAAGAVSDWLGAAAVTAAAETIDPVLVARVLGVAVDQADAGLSAAARQGTIELVNPDGEHPQVRFAGSAARQRILAELGVTPARARRLHAAAYADLTTGPGQHAADPVRVARHALAARPDLPDDVVAAACLAAATAELHARRLDPAIEFALRGLSLTGDSELRFRLQIAHGDARHDRADLRAAETAYRAAYAEAGEQPELRAIAVVRMARRWSDPGRIDESLLAMLRSSRDALAGADDPGLVELWMQVSGHLAHKSTLAVVWADPVANPPPGVELAHATLDALTPSTTPVVACEVLTECRWALFDFAPAAQIREISARMEAVAAGSGSDHFNGEALIATVIDHLRLGDIAAAHNAGERHRQHVARTGHGLGPWLQITLDTLFDLWEGDLGAAEQRVFGPMLQAVQQDLSDSLQQTWMGQVIWLRREQGRMPELLSYGIGRLVERRQYFPVWVAGIALLLSEVGQRTAAVDQLIGLLDQTADLQTLPPHGWAVPTLALIAETIDCLNGDRGGHHAERPGAERLDLAALAHRVDVLLAPHTDEVVLAGWPTVLFGPARRARGLLALATADADAAGQHFEDAIASIPGAPAQVAWLRHHQARALLVHPSSRRIATARDLLHAALEVADQKGMTALATSTRRELEGVDAPALPRG